MPSYISPHPERSAKGAQSNGRTVSAQTLHIYRLSGGRGVASGGIEWRWTLRIIDTVV